MTILRLSGCVMAVILTPSLRAQPAGFRGLGPGSRADALSADGSTVVAGDARWTVATGWTVMQPGAAWWANALSGDGLGAVGQESPEYAGEAVRWSLTSGLVGQGFPGGYHAFSLLRGVSFAGDVAIGEAGKDVQSTCPGGLERRVIACYQRHPGGPFRPLRPLSGSNSSRARRVSGDGTKILGESFDVGCGWLEGAQRPCLWTVSEEVPVPIGITRANAISRDGSIIVGANAGVAVRWTQAGGVVSLGVLPGYATSEARWVSGDGSTIVGESSAPPFTADPVAFIWDEAHGLRNLRDVLVGLGLDLAGWTLNDTVGISEDGRTIAGNFWNVVGPRQGWIAFLGDPVNTCYANCDASTAPPFLSVNDFTCFLNRFASGDSYANCDASTIAPILNVNDFTCFVSRYAAGCP